ncbi:nucleotide exchange factor GrpE [Pirellulales bacterium]|nr:nucleotide exchange factor GrpE [Pirellulales bacterium]
MLTSHEIDDVVERLREWLVVSNEELENRDFDDVVQAIRTGAAREVGLLEVAEAFTALRHDAKLQTKSVRALTDRLELGLEALRDAESAMQEATTAAENQASDQERQLIDTLLDIDEALAHAVATCLAPATQNPPPALESEAGAKPLKPLPRWRRAIQRTWRKASTALRDRTASNVPASNQGEIASGLEMLRTKLRRTLADFSVVRIDGVDQPVDPNQMQVVATVADPQKKPGTVIEQIRPGYLHRGQVLRHAEVTVVAES